MRVEGAALACYPGWWRGRYQEEVALVLDALAAEGRSPSCLALSVFWGVLDARIHGTGMPMELGSALGARTAVKSWRVARAL